MPVCGQTGHTQRLQTGLDLRITLIPSVQLNSQIGVSLPHRNLYVNGGRPDRQTRGGAQEVDRICGDLL